jgi:hypothetical protein
MAERKITQTRKGYAGDILALCNPDESWSPRFKNDAIRDIESNLHNYYVEVNNDRINILVEIKRGSKRLVTNKQELLTNKLEQLKDC